MRTSQAEPSVVQEKQADEEFETFGQMSCIFLELNGIEMITAEMWKIKYIHTPSNCDLRVTDRLTSHNGLLKHMIHNEKQLAFKRKNKQR